MSTIKWTASVIAVAGTLLLLLAPGAHASFIDPLDTTANFGGNFGGTTATANGNGTVTLTRTVSGGDAGVNWEIGGTTHVPLDFYTDHLIITPVGTTNGGFYSISLLLFNNVNAFLGEPYLVLNSNSTSPLDLPSVSAFAAANSISAPASYMVRFRIEPTAQAGAEFTFTEIAAIPEPASAAIIVGGALLLLRRRRGT